MSVKKYPGRKKEMIFKHLPYIINNHPEYEPKEVFGEDMYNTNEDMIRKSFEFLAISPKKREVIYSITNHTFRCLWCGKQMIEIGFEFDTLVKQHKKECFLPYFIVNDVNRIDTNKIKRNEYFIRITNELHDKTIKFTLKKKYWKKDEELLTILKKDLNSLRKNQSLTIDLIREKHKEFFKMKIEK